MPKYQIKRPTLLLRTAHFTDGLIAETGLSAEQIERRVRENQYDRYKEPAPELETVLDYFSLYRSVAFEPRQTDFHAPWLLAAEREFPGCSYRYFHPLVDLLFGPLESSAFWEAHFRKIPSIWIDEEEREGRPEVAAEWRAMNNALEKRVHRRKGSPSGVDQLALVHLSLMRLPTQISGRLFSKAGLASSWTRSYHLQPTDFAFAEEAPPADGLAALLGLAMEAAEIGDSDRFQRAKAHIDSFLPKLREDPACRRIHEVIGTHVANHLESLTPRRYSHTLYHGFGAPASWRAMVTKACLHRQMERYGAVVSDDENDDQWAPSLSRDH